MSELDQLKAIRDGAPDGATHYLTDHEYHITYVKRYFENGTWFWLYPKSGWLEFDRMPTNQNINSLSDLREILALREEVDRLKQITLDQQTQINQLTGQYDD